MALEAWSPQGSDSSLYGRLAIGFGVAMAVIAYSGAFVALAATPGERKAMLPSEAQDLQLEEEPPPPEKELEEEDEPDPPEPEPPPPPPENQPPPQEDSAPAMAKGDVEAEVPPEEIEEKELKEKEPVKQTKPSQKKTWGSKTGCDPKKDPNCSLSPGARTDGKKGGTGTGRGEPQKKPAPKKKKVKKKKKLYRAVDIAVPPKKQGCSVGFSAPGNIEGTAIVRYIVTEFGSVVGVRAVRGPGPLRAPCVAYYKSCRFSPAKLADGSQVATARFGRCRAKLAAR